MALGDGNNNYGSNNGSSGGGKVYDNTFYSRIRFRNNNKMTLTFSFRSGLLRVSINEEKESYKYEEKTFINLSAAKARLLRDILIKEFKPNMATLDPNKAFGVNAGIGETVSFIAFHVTGNVPGEVPEYAVTIGKIDNSGNVTQCHDFVFNADYHYALQWDNLSTMDVSKVVDDYLELDTFIDILNEFVNSASGATGYNTFDVGRYEIHRYIDPIYNKLGIERGKKSNGSNGGGDNYFSGSPRSQSRTLDDFDDMM